MKDELVIESEDSNANVIAKLAAATAEPQIVPDHQNTPFVLVPSGYEVKDLSDLERTQPRRIVARVAFHDVESLVRYADRFAGSPIAVFASPDPQKPAVGVVFDYHAGDLPSYCSHRAALVFRATKEWEEWTAASGKGMDQVAFARFIESHLTDVLRPDGAQLLEVVRTLEATKGVTFRSSVRLDNGERQFEYEEEIKASAGGTTAKRGHLEVPQKFTLALRLWKGQVLRWEVEALLRFRIDQGGALSLWFDLVRPDDVVEAAFNKTIAALQAKWPEAFFLGAFEG